MNKGEKTEIRAVFFDLGNVLIEFPVRKVIKKIAWAVGANPLRVAKLVWARDLADDIERGEVTPSELYAIFQEELGFKGDFGDFVALWCGHFRLIRKSTGILRRVAKRRPVYLLSNTNRLHFEFIRANYSFFKYLKGAVLSYRLGLRKPEKAIYDAAVARARVNPEHSLFIDDLLENVEGARKAGMQALRFTSPEKLESDLARIELL